MGGSKLSRAEKKKRKKDQWRDSELNCSSISSNLYEKQGAKTIRKGISSPLSDHGFKPHIQPAQRWPTCMHSPLAAILKEEEGTVSSCWPPHDSVTHLTASTYFCESSYLITIACYFFFIISLLLISVSLIHCFIHHCFHGTILFYCCLKYQEFDVLRCVSSCWCQISKVTDFQYPAVLLLDIYSVCIITCSKHCSRNGNNAKIARHKCPGQNNCDSWFLSW